MEHTNTPNNVQGTLTIMDQQLIVLIVFIHMGGLLVVKSKMLHKFQLGDMD